MVNYKLCAFADEADASLAGQIRAMLDNEIEYLEMRGVNGTNVAKLTTAEAKSAAAELKAAGIKVWALGSPAGKTQITDPFDFEQEQFKRLLETADITGAHAIRLFSFYGTGGSAEYRDEVMERLSRFVELAKGSGIVLCHENEKGIYGEDAAHCLEIHQAIPEIKGVFDPANFLQSHQATIPAWDLLEPYIYYGHIKDANENRKVVPPGMGAGQLPVYLKRFFAKGCEVLTLEPHLARFVGLKGLENGEVTQSATSWSFATPREAFDYAASALKSILKEL
ncbi:MAG: sugar phosphate isomerase/epimerase [Clostridia bacterium]|nr:sugar phosphate isomerase/epimerase [Clostridia bacterium]